MLLKCSSALLKTTDSASNSFLLNLNQDADSALIKI